MKVTITKESLNYLTVSEYAKAKEIVRDMKEDEMPLTDYAEFAANAILGSKRYGEHDVLRSILKASAHITRDQATDYNRFGEDCGYLNVWIESVAETYDGFIKFGCLLSDIWNLDGSMESKTALCDHAYIQYAPFVK